MRWLVAQLKVPLRPVRTPAGEALVKVAGNGHGEKVWKVVWAELRRCTRDIEGAISVFASASEGDSGMEGKPEEGGLEVPELRQVGLERVQ